MATPFRSAGRGTSFLASHAFLSMPLGLDADYCTDPCWGSTILDTRIVAPHENDNFSGPRVTVIAINGGLIRRKQWASSCCIGMRRARAVGDLEGGRHDVRRQTG